MFKQIRHFLRERKKRRLREKLAFMYLVKLSCVDYFSIDRDIRFIFDGLKQEG